MFPEWYDDNVHRIDCTGTGMKKYFEDYSNTEFSEEWSKEFKSMTFCKQME